MQAIATHDATIDSAAFTQRPLAAQQAILDTLIDYHQFAFNPLSQAPLAIRTDYSAALARRFLLPAGGTAASTPAPESPDHGRPPGWVQAGAEHNSALGDSLALRIRSAYYDPLDTEPGQAPNSALTMGDTQLQFFRKTIRIARIDAVAIRSAGLAVSGLKGDDGNSWNIRAGVEQARLWCSQCLVMRAQGDMGGGREWLPNFYAGAFVGAAVQNARAQQGIGFARMGANVIAHPAPRLGAELTAELREPLGPFRNPYLAAAGSVRWLLGPFSDLRVHYEHDRANDVRIAWGWYW